MIKEISYRSDNNILIFYDRYIIYYFRDSRYNIKWYLYNYFYFIKNGLKVPKLLSFSYSKNYYIQEKINDFNNDDIYKENFLNIYKKLELFYKNNSNSFYKFNSIKTIRHCFYDIKNIKTIGEFLINFLDFIFKKNNIKKGALINEYSIIKNKILKNKKDFLDKNIYFIHGDLKINNILITKKNEIFFIDFENSGWFDKYYDYALLYLNDKITFEKYLLKNINKMRLEVNLDIYNFLNKVYNTNK